MWAPQCRKISTKASRVRVWFASGALSSLLSVLFKPYAVTFCVLDLRAVTDEWNATNAKRCTVNDVGVSNRARSLLIVSKCFVFFQRILTWRTYVSQVQRVRIVAFHSLTTAHYPAILEGKEERGRTCAIRRLRTFDSLILPSGALFNLVPSCLVDFIIYMHSYVISLQIRQHCLYVLCCAVMWFLGDISRIECIYFFFPLCKIPYNSLLSLCQ